MKKQLEPRHKRLIREIYGANNPAANRLTIRGTLVSTNHGTSDLCGATTKVTMIL